MHPLVTKLLANRGITDEGEAMRFLNPDFERDTHDPFLLKDMRRAVERILGGVEKNELIVLYTDYDTDGTPAGVILHDFFKKIGYDNFENYIPHRHDEGYGLHTDALDGFAKRGATLLITADCGISNYDEIAHAREIGIDVIVTDHHTPPPELPKAFAIINPLQEGDDYPFKWLCGAGVAWKLVCALLHDGRHRKLFDVYEGWEKWLLDMVAIATVSDMVSLTGENRALARYGLIVLRKSNRPGIRALLRNAGVTQRDLVEDDIGFTIGPRINVASRMDTPRKAFLLLSTRDNEEAESLAQELDALNKKRKGAVASIIKEAKRRLAMVAEMPPVIVMGDLNWHPGLLGLAANTLMNDTGRTVFLWGGASSMIRGSCRGTGDVHVVELMSRVVQHFVNYGGHEAAGGFSLTRETLHTLPEALCRAYEETPKRAASKRERHAEAELSLEDVSWATHRLLEQLAPFGTGNAKPLFRFSETPIKTAAPFGKEKNHLKVILKKESGESVEAIQFFPPEELLFGFPKERVTFSAHIEKNTFRGAMSLRLRIVDVE